MLQKNDEYKPGELFVYENGDRWELGVVKSPNNTNDGYFCYYSRGDTAANTPLHCMHKLANSGWSKVEQQLDDLNNLAHKLFLIARSVLDEEQIEYYEDEFRYAGMDV